MKIDFVSDVVCPWCAIGLASLEQALQRVAPGIEPSIHFQPFELNPDMPPEGEDIVLHLTRKYGSTPEQVAANAEAIRQQLIGDQPWSILGQSYGGFCAMRYLSAGPEGLKHVLITGGIPSLTRPADDVYRATYRRVADKNRLYYQRYPDDVAVVRRIVDHLQAHSIQLPGGGDLTVPRFLQLGLQLGMSGGFEAVHYLLEEAFVASAGGQALLNWNFLFHLEQMQ